jgi:3-hydroxyacyl-CoA dehydrogenase
MHHLADTLTGSHADMTDEVSEKDVLKLEVQNIMQLFKTQGTLARIEHMLETGRPLRN